jgi:hypothetical protein
VDRPGRGYIKRSLGVRDLLPNKGFQWSIDGVVHLKREGLTSHFRATASPGSASKYAMVVSVGLIPIYKTVGSMTELEGMRFTLAESAVTLVDSRVPDQGRLKQDAHHILGRRRSSLHCDRSQRCKRDPGRHRHPLYDRRICCSSSSWTRVLGPVQS